MILFEGNIFMQRKSLYAAVAAIAVLVSALAPAGLAAQEAKGTLTGFVADVRSGEFVRHAGVEVVGAGKTVYTGVEGDYTVELPPGTYVVRFFFDGFIEKKEEFVTITAGETTQIDAVLTPVGYGESVDIIAGAGDDVIATIEERR
jgi:hypothetical protein